MAVQSHRFDKRIAPHFFCATNTILGAGVDRISIMSLKQVYDKVTNCPLNDWVEKMNNQLRDYQIGYPSMEDVVRNYAFPLLSEYNEHIYSMKGKFTAEHRSPGEKERKEMAEIVAALLVKRQIKPEYDNEIPVLDDIINRLSELQVEKESKQR